MKGMKERILIFTGKGGVGKTSIAAAHTVKAAKEGVNTLLVSTDMAHNLSDLFGTPLGKTPKKVMDCLTVYEIDANYILEHDFGNLTECFTKMFPASKELSPEEMGIMPGMEELFALLKISQLYEEKTYDLIVVDCAPTGETLSMLKMPELLSWYMEKLFPIGKMAMRVLAPVSKKAFQVELPNKKAMTDIEILYGKLLALQQLFKNQEVTSIRIVTVPEKMIVEETKRNYMYMNLFHYNVDGIYVNRVLPKDMDNPFFEQWIGIQQTYMQELKESFHGLPMWEIPWFDQEVDGVEGISQMAEKYLDDKKLFEIWQVHAKEQFEKDGDTYLLKISIPGVKKETMELYQTSNDVVIRVNNVKRNITLPDVLRKYEITKADIEEDTLVIRFEKEEDEYA